MAQKLTAGLPNSLHLGPGYTLEFAAVDPNTGAAVAGVTVSGSYVICEQLTPGGPEALVEDVEPLWVAIPFGPGDVTGGTGGGTPAAATLTSLNTAVQADPTVNQAEAQWAAALTSVLAA